MSSSPYSATDPSQTPQQDNTLKIVLIVLGVVLLAVMLVCGGIMAAGYFAVRQVATEFEEGFSEAFGGGFTRQYLDTPEAKEALGEVQKTALLFENTADDDDGNLEIRVEGSKGSGTLIIGADEEGNELVQLVMDDGRIIDLPPAAAYEEPNLEEALPEQEVQPQPLR
ncbi:Coa1/Tim21 domain-containing protein [Roseimaritima sediminicola]|uniref:hypothetical protein n=1 Tax=Roseimaritima sediminicola TaxID=2662066 RepID=UPI0012983B3E|nr:hypothetical protein [Roseimaritima sediminicola]